MNLWKRWRDNVEMLTEPGLPLRAKHLVAYKALLADLVWEKQITEAEMVRRLRKVQH